jgi:hypothetical protein
MDVLLRPAGLVMLIVIVFTIAAALRPRRRAALDLEERHH